MSDFFAGVNGARFPDVVINGGGNPLPGMGGLPTPLHDTPDGKINYNSSLLGDLEPYAYGEPGYLSSQSSYLNIPHRIQKLVPALWIPETDGTGSFRLCHPIDDGDIAFAMRLDRNSEVCTGLRSKHVLRSGLGTAIDPMINLCTLNYILAGMQICTILDATRPAWDRLFNYLDKYRFPGHVAGAGAHNYTFDDIKHLVRHLCRPLGVAHGSEKQGGQHEGSLAPVTWPVDFVISLVLDGKDANMVNIWHRFDVESGNDLVLRLKHVPLPPGNKYTLNHYAKGLMEKTFSPNLLNQIHATGVPLITHIWQLVPDVFSLDLEQTYNGVVGNPFFPYEVRSVQARFMPQGGEYVWQQAGYWHIARAQIHCKRYGTEEYYYNDLANNLRTGHMDVTFQPTFQSVPYRDFAAPVAPAVFGRRGRNVFNVLGDEAPPDSGKRSWNHTLRLEKGFGMSSESAMDMSQSADSRHVSTYDTLRDSSLVSDNSMGHSKRVRFSGDRVSVNVDASESQSVINAPVPTLDRSRSTVSSVVVPEVPRFSFEEEDIGVLEDAGPLMVASSSAAVVSTESAAVAATTGGGAVAAPASQFSVPKPGLKASKRPSARGKGVIGAVLAPDGTVTHEQSRML
jgi:hypothetical protein